MFFKKRKGTDLVPENLPVHIGFIMDGNGRWAKKHGLPRQYGHKEGANAFKKIVRYCKDIGIKYITFYAFSTENWKRPKEEVDAILMLFRQYLSEVREHIGEEVKVVFLGDKDAFDDELKNEMLSLENDSRDFNKMTLLLAINYGGRDDIIHAVKNISQLVKDDFLSVNDINEKLVSDFLYTSGIPDVDFVIRPSGELRLSNFLIWQCAYAEYYFTDILWPDFSPDDLLKALNDYSLRKRRFGGV